MTIVDLTHISFWLMVMMLIPCLRLIFNEVFLYKCEKVLQCRDGFCSIAVSI